MRSSGERYDRDQAERLYNALRATVNTFIAAEGASHTVIAQGCGEFLAMVLAGLSVEHGDTEAQLAGRIATYTEVIAHSIRRNFQTLQRSRSQ
jgi:hypothetical protein